MISTLFSLKGRVALVTGGNGGLGRDIALGLRGAGATVAITGRDEQRNCAAAKELGTAGAVIPGDVRDEDAVAAAVADVVERFGHLDVLVNNAGNFSGGSLLEMSRESWDSVVETHLTGSFLCAKHAARQMVERGQGGKIINIGSMYSIFGPPAYVNYAAAKTGVLGLTRALAVELGAHGIQVNAILPGWFETALTGGRRLPSGVSGSVARRPPPAGAPARTSWERRSSWRRVPRTSSPAWRCPSTAATRWPTACCRSSSDDAPSSEPSDVGHGRARPRRRAASEARRVFGRRRRRRTPKYARP